MNHLTERAEDSETENLIEEIHRLIRITNARTVIDWDAKPYEYFHLFSVWREAEASVENLRQSRIQWLVKSYLG